MKERLHPRRIVYPVFALALGLAACSDPEASKPAPTSSEIIADSPKTSFLEQKKFVLIDMHGEREEVSASVHLTFSGDNMITTAKMDETQNTVELTQDCVNRTLELGDEHITLEGPWGIPLSVNRDAVLSSGGYLPEKIEALRLLAKNVSGVVLLEPNACQDGKLDASDLA